MTASERRDLSQPYDSPAPYIPPNRIVASMYGCTPGGPGFESRFGPSLVIESSCIVSLSNSPELGSGRCFTPVPSVLRLNSHWSCRAVVPPEYESDRKRECTCVCAYT
ncbi:unnamed protein product, partial [Brenthis ino]